MDSNYNTYLNYFWITQKDLKYCFPPSTVGTVQPFLGSGILKKATIIIESLHKISSNRKKNCESHFYPKWSYHNGGYSQIKTRHPTIVDVPYRYYVLTQAPGIQDQLMDNRQCVSCSKYSIFKLRKYFIKQKILTRKNHNNSMLWRLTEVEHLTKKG